MKKTLAVLLAVLAVFSMFSMAFAAENPSTAAPILVQFYVDGKLYHNASVKSGEILTPYAPKDPVKEDTDTTRYTFIGWQETDASGKPVDEELYYKSTLPSPVLAEGETSKTVIYTAVFSEKNIEGRQTFWNLIESIFERFNKIFEYFAEIFGF